MVISFIGGCAFLLSSCGIFKKSPSPAEKLREAIRKSHDINEDNTGGGLSGLRDITPKVTANQLPDEDDIIWAPENPDAPIETLEGLWENPVQFEWYVSYDKAMKDARREGKPVLMWFTNSKSSPNCKLLSNQIFSANMFKEWAKDKVVRLRIDSFIQDDNKDLLERKVDYVENLKKRYKVLGAPVVLLLSPRGTVFGRYVGYKGGDAQFYFGRLRQAHRLAMNDYGEWKETMEKRGYRTWHDNRGRSVFAKLKRYYRGQLLLVDPDGKLSKTSERKLSPEDREYIAQEKEKRGIR